MTEWEMGDQNKTACLLCIQQHLLEQTSATGDNGEGVETIAYQYYTQTVL